MKLLYDYLMRPTQTVQLYNHHKNWQTWWMVMVVGAVLLSIKWTTVGMLSIVMATLIQVSGVIFYAILLDASAQLIGERGQLRSIVYWLGFAQAIYWLLPSAEMIQGVLFSIGNGIIFAINIIYAVYVWKTIRQLLGNSIKKTIAIVLFPLVIFSVSLVVFSVWLIQQMVNI